MPTLKLSKSFIANLKITANRVDYFDKEVKGLLLRCYPSGTKTYQIYYRNKKNQQKRFTIAKHPAVTLTQARHIATLKLGEIYAGVDVQTEKIKERIAQSEAITFRVYIHEFYLDWFKTHRKGDRSTINILNNTLNFLDDKPFDAIDCNLMNDFIMNYQKDRQVSNARINRIMTALKAALSVAVDYNYIEINKLPGVKMLHEDKHKIVRYLTTSEENRLLKACESIYPVYRAIVHLALNTGMRAGEIITLQWSDVNFKRKYIALRSENTKAQKTRYIPTNDKARKALEIALEHKISDYVFTNPKTKTKYTK